MKSCNRYEKMLPGYLHGELYEKDFHALRAHLENCASCRAELQSQYQVLKLAGRVMASVPTPARMTARRHLPTRKVDLRSSAAARIWYSPQFRAALATGVIAASFFFVSGLFVVFTAVEKAAPSFEAPPPLERPKMSLRKLQVAADKSARADTAEASAAGSSGVPDRFAAVGGSIEPESTKFGAMAVDRPKMSLAKPAVKVSKGSAPKPSSRVVAKVKTAPMPSIVLPDMEGTGEGLLSISGSARGRSDVSPAAGIAGVELGADESAASVEWFGLNAEAEVVNTRGAGMQDLGFSLSKLDSDGLASADQVQGYSSYADPFAEPSSGARANEPWNQPAKWEEAPGDRVTTVSRDHAMGRTFDDAYETKELVAMDSIRQEMVDGDFYYREADMDQAGGMDDLFGGGEMVAGYSLNGSGVKKDAPETAPEPVPVELAELETDLAVLSDVQGAEENQQVLFAQGENLYQAGDYEGAILYFEEALAENPYDRRSMEYLRRIASRESEEHGRRRETDRVEAFADIEAGWAMADIQPVEVERPKKPAVFNPYVMTADQAFSTFSIDVDTASYGLVRQQLLSGSLPDPEAVRTEEFVNSFDYDYRPPAGTQTFAIHTEAAPSPFRSRMEILKIGIKGRRIGRDDHRGAHLTLVIDTSGSMSTPERLGLVKQSLLLLLDQLNPEDTVAIVQFGGEARLVCEHTPVTEKSALIEAVHQLQAGGPTQFDKGLELGYQVAASAFTSGDSNRIIIMSDGVATLGELDPGAILDQISAFRKKGIYLSVLGFGAGTYDDDMLEQLANRGDGTYAYVDTSDEARHLFVDQLAATLHTIASDVKIQVEFNPARVLRYRQIGYENRQLTKEQFRDDTVDAGEVGSGQSVTALYEVELKPDGPSREPIATVYVRYRREDNGVVEEISSRVTDMNRKLRFEDSSPRFRLAVCVAEFAECLRRSPYAEGTEMNDILTRLQPVVLELSLDERIEELLRLISIAGALEH